MWFAFGIVAMTKKQEACTTVIFHVTITTFLKSQLLLWQSGQL